MDRTAWLSNCARENRATPGWQIPLPPGVDARRAASTETPFYEDDPFGGRSGSSTLVALALAGGLKCPVFYRSRARPALRVRRGRWWWLFHAVVIPWCARIGEDPRFSRVSPYLGHHPSAVIVGQAIRCPATRYRPAVDELNCGSACTELAALQGHLSAAPTQVLGGAPTRRQGLTPTGALETRKFPAACYPGVWQHEGSQKAKSRRCGPAAGQSTHRMGDQDKPNRIVRRARRPPPPLVHVFRFQLTPISRLVSTRRLRFGPRFEVLSA